MSDLDKLTAEFHEIFGETPLAEEFDKHDSDPPGTPRDSSNPPPKGNVSFEGEPEDYNGEPETEEVGDDEPESDHMDALLDKAVDEFDALIATVNNLKGIFKQIRQGMQAPEDEE